jgi:hypothetical protein
LNLHKTAWNHMISLKNTALFAMDFGITKTYIWECYKPWEIRTSDENDFRWSSYFKDLIESLQLLISYHLCNLWIWSQRILFTL